MKVTFKSSYKSVSFHSLTPGDTFVNAISSGLVKMKVTGSLNHNAVNFDGTSYHIDKDEPVFLVECDVTVTLV